MGNHKGNTTWATIKGIQPFMARAPIGDDDDQENQLNIPNKICGTEYVFF